MIFRLRSGEMTPRSAATNSSAASTPSTLSDSFLRNLSMRSWYWPLRRRPLSTKMQVRRRPMARWMMSDVTSESTPPLRPQTTLLPADHAPDLLDLALDERAHVPVGLEAGQLEEEIAEDLFALLGVDDLGMELHAVETAVRVFDDGRFRVRRPARDRGSRAAAFRAGRRGSSRPARDP